MEGNFEIYNEMLEDIYNRSGGRYENMTYTDKLLMISIMKEKKKFIDEMLKDFYPLMSAWAELDPAQIQLEEKNAEIEKIRNIINFKTRGLKYV